MGEHRVGPHVHFAAYLPVSSLAISLWWWSRGWFPWFLFVTMFWSTAAVSHGVSAFMDHDYIDRVAEREYQRLRGQR